MLRVGRTGPPLATALEPAFASPLAVLQPPAASAANAANVLTWVHIKDVTQLPDKVGGRRQGRRQGEAAIHGLPLLGA